MYEKIEGCEQSSIVLVSGSLTTWEFLLEEGVYEQRHLKSEKIDASFIIIIIVVIIFMTLIIAG